MNKHMSSVAALFLVFLSCGLVFAKMSADRDSKPDLSPAVVPVANQTNIQRADKVEVFLFHATNRCFSCETIGQWAGETVNEYYPSEIQAGRIEFREINIDLPENRDLAEKFQASGSALFINSIRNNEDHIAQDTRVWRLLDDKAAFKSYLKGELDGYLALQI